MCFMLPEITIFFSSASHKSLLNLELNNLNTINYKNSRVLLYKWRFLRLLQRVASKSEPKYFQSYSACIAYTIHTQIICRLCKYVMWSRVLTMRRYMKNDLKLWHLLSAINHLFIICGKINKFIDFLQLAFKGLYRIRKLHKVELSSHIIKFANDEFSLCALFSLFKVSGFLLHSIYGVCTPYIQ